MTGNRISLAIALVLVLADIAIVARAGLFVTTFPGDELKPLCEGKPTNLTLRSHLDALLEQAEDLVESGKCTQYIHLALKKLKELLGSESDPICTMDKAEKIMAYYLKYLDTSSGTGAMVKLPRSLRHFVLGYGMQVSKLCNKNVAEDFVGQQAQKLISKWLIRPAELFSSKGYLRSILEIGRDPADILITYLLPLFPTWGEEIRKELSADMSDSRYVARKKAICERLYRPIYELNILPVSVLASIGLEYRDKFFKKHPNPDNLGYWSQMVFLCEIISGIAVDKESGGDTSTTDDIPLLKISRKSSCKDDDGEPYYKVVQNSIMKVKFFPIDESDTGEGEEIEEDTGEEETSEDATPTNHDIIRAVYCSDFTVGDVVYNKKDAKLVAAVKSFRTDRKWEERFVDLAFNYSGAWMCLNKKWSASKAASIMSQCRAAHAASALK